MKDNSLYAVLVLLVLTLLGMWWYSTRVSAPPAANGTPSVSSEACAAFASAPSCDYVPAGQARDLCTKCKAL